MKAVLTPFTPACNRKRFLGLPKVDLNSELFFRIHHGLQRTYGAPCKKGDGDGTNLRPKRDVNVR